MIGKQFDFSKVEGLNERFPQNGITGFSFAATVSPGDAYAKKAKMLMGKGEYANSLAASDEAIRLGPKHSEGYNGKAYLLAICPDAKLRDGKQAITLAKKALELTGDNFNTSNVLDTLACAYAEAGDFENAVMVCEEALKKASPFAKPDFEKKMKLFQEKMPYHLDPPKK
jgi:tetratricopeptide (TPR) repeat protein